MSNNPFVVLTGLHGNKLWVIAQHISMVEPDGKGSVVRIGYHKEYVRESAAEVVKAVRIALVGP